MNNLINYLLLALIVVFVTAQNILKKVYNKKCNTGVYLYSAMISFFALLFFIAVNREWSFRPQMLIPAAFFALAYASATVFAVVAIKYGSLAITSLVISYSLLIPCFYGIFFLGESISWLLIVGVILLAISLFLTNHEKSNDLSEKKSFSLKWVIFCVLAFVGNGMCSTVQKAAGVNGFSSSDLNMIMIIALAMVAVVLFVISACTSERKEWKACFKAGTVPALASGIMNGAVNYMVLVLNTRLAASVMFPIISGGGLVLVFLYSTVIDKERFRVSQWIGFGIGLISIVLLNI